MAPARDRDASGRAHNARPRDALGRPLPREAAGVPEIPEDLELDPQATVVLAQQLLDADRPFQAHEVLESMWRRCPDPERDLWQGLAQLAVGITHVRRGNLNGGARLLRRAGLRLTPYRGSTPYGIAVDRIAARLDEWTARLAAGEPPELTLTLTENL